MLYESHDHSQAERSIQSSVIPAEGLVRTDLWGSVCEMVPGWPDAARIFSMAREHRLARGVHIMFYASTQANTNHCRRLVCFLSLEGRMTRPCASCQEELLRTGKQMCVRESRTLPICFHIITHVGSGDGCVANGFHWIFVNVFLIKNQTCLLLF